MFTSINTVIFYVSDINKSKSFYTTLLGFRITDDQGEFIKLQLTPSSTFLALNSSSEYENLRGNCTIILNTNNIQLAYQKIKKENITISMELQSMPWGMTFIFQDPDGNRIEVLEA